eukprot:425833-Rhodomonas_salina.3
MLFSRSWEGALSLARTRSRPATSQIVQAVLSLLLGCDCAVCAQQAAAAELFMPQTYNARHNSCVVLMCTEKLVSYNGCARNCTGQARKFRMECEFQSAPPDEAFASIVDETALRARVLCPWSITRFAAPETLRTSPFVWLLSPAADPLLRAGMQREGGESATGE